MIPILLTGLLACGFATLHPAPLADTIPLLEVRLAYYEQAPDLERVEYDGQVLFLASDPVISDIDLLEVQPSVGHETLYLSVRCTEEASHRMELASGRHLDQPMVVLFESELKAASVVRGSVGCLDLVMGWAATEAEAERMAEKIRARWVEDGI